MQRLVWELKIRIRSMYLQCSCGRCRCSRVIQKTATENLDVLPATIQLAGAEIELVPTISREVRLQRALQPVRDEYDYIIIDCPRP